MVIIQSKCVFCTGITLMLKWKCLRAMRIVGEICVSLQGFPFSHMRAGCAWGWGGVGRWRVWALSGMPFCRFEHLEPLSSMGPACWRMGAFSKMSDKISATCCMDQSLQRPQGMAGQTVPLFSYLAWLALRTSWVESGLGVREGPAVQGWCVTLRESQ